MIGCQLTTDGKRCAKRGLLCEVSRSLSSVCTVLCKRHRWNLPYNREWRGVKITVLGVMPYSADGRKNENR